MSVIEKIKWLYDTAKATHEKTLDKYDAGAMDAYADCHRELAEDPAHTAREKARKVAELWKLSSQYSPVVHWDGYRKQWLAEDDYPLTLMMESVPLDLTPTPEEIATGCCCYVVPKKGETDAIHS